VHAINTVDGPGTGTPRDRVRRWTGLPYLSRAGWGADESLRFNPDGTEKFPTAFFDVQTLTVHHTVTANSDPDPAATVRAVYFFQCITEDWGDIGYHLLIDQAGTVYEGRYSGPDLLPVFGPRPVGPRPSMVNGAHVGGFNAGNVGVALLGDLTSVSPTPAARRSLVAVLAALARVTDRDPLGTTSYVNPISGATRTVKTLAGHRDWAATECPGNAFYPTLPSLREDVAAAL
jgi:N-acetylmuramoyl-L-alanine amidase-like protein